MIIKKTAGKRILCTLLSIAMILCMTPGMAFAKSDVKEGQKTVSVDITAQAEGSFLAAPAFGADVSGDLAEAYGYTDEVSDGVSALDVLVKAHEIIFADAFTRETASDFLDVSGSGWVSTVFGQKTPAFTFAINGDYPYDPNSSYSSTTGYTGYFITQAPVTDGASVEFFINQDQDMYFDFYTYFEQEGKRVSQIEATAGSRINLNVQGYIYAFGGPFVGEDRVNQGSLGAVSGAEIGIVNADTGEVKPISGAVTDDNGDVEVSFDSAGSYYLAAYGRENNFSAPLYMTLLKIVVKEADPTPKIKIDKTGGLLPTDDGYDYSEERGFSYNIGEKAETFTVSCESDIKGGEYSYEWYSSTVPGSHGGKKVGAEASCTPDTSKPTAKGDYYACKVTYTVGGKSYTAWSDDEALVYVYVKAKSAEKPVISRQPSSASYITGEEPAEIKVAAMIKDGGTKSYQWYKNDKKSTEGAQPVSGAVKNTFTPQATEKSSKTYYYCQVTNTLQKFAETQISDIVCIEFRSLEDIVGNSFKGDGTEKKPYLLNDAEDFKILASFVKDGVSFKGSFFEITSDIEMPEDWDGIGYDTGSGTNGANLKPFSATLNGGGNKLSFAEGSKPLFNYVREATVKNLDIYAPYIPYNGLVANYVVDYGRSGTGSAVAVLDAENVTIKAGSVIKGSGFIGGYASGKNTVNITGCEVEKGVKIGWDAEKNQPAAESRIGSFGGDFNGTIKNSVSAAEVYGENYVGGIVGGKGQTVGEYIIENCSFTGKVSAGGTFAGGIAGGGYSGYRWGVTSAPNTPCATIQNCYVSAEISGKDCVGGILGGEEGSTQNWGEAYVRNNLFTGKLTASSGNAGGIIGYMNSLNAKNIIENNYYYDSSSSEGIGKITYIDTNSPNHETESGARYFDTSKEINGQGAPGGVIKRNHNRTDDPAGADKEKLAAGVSEKQMKSGEITDALNNGEGSFKNWKQGEASPILNIKITEVRLELSGEFKNSYKLGEELDLSGAEIKVIYSDGSEKNVDWTSLKIEGYDKNKRGVQQIKLSYGAASATIDVTVIKDEASKITVYLSVFGDSPHGEGDDKHTLAGGNLTAWMGKTAYEVDANATVLDVITLAAEQNGMVIKNPAGNYITEVTYKGHTIGEFTNGSMSGWMFNLNGIYADKSVDKQLLEDGDIIIFHYTDDYSKENINFGHEASEVIKMIDSLPESEKLTLKDAAAVTEAKRAFETLSEAEKNLISEARQEKLRTAVLRIEELQREETAELKAAYERTGEELKQLMEKNAVYGEEWIIIGLARAGILSDSVKNSYYSDLVKALKTNGSAKLHENKSTENSRVVLALTSMGIDASDVAGYNLLEPLSDMDYLNRQGINGVIFALIAFDSHNYEIPMTGNTGKQATRNSLVETVLSAQLKDGGWALYGEKGDPDMTAMALQALAPYIDEAEVKEAAGRAIECLSEMQDKNGGFGSWGTINSESCAQVIIALTSLGINPAEDMRFIKDGNSLTDALLSFYTGEGFEHTAGGGFNKMATEQAYAAMTSYIRLTEDKTAFYDMNDVKFISCSEDDGRGENPGTAGNNNDANETGDGGFHETKPEKTGDENSMGLWITLALAGSVGILIVRRKRKEDNAA